MFFFDVIATPQVALLTLAIVAILEIHRQISTFDYSTRN